MTTEQRAIAELATLVAEMIRRAGAAYGDREEWRQDITRAVQVFETMQTAGDPLRERLDRMGVEERFRNQR